MESEDATLETRRRTFLSASDEPTMSSNIESRSICSRQRQIFVPRPLFRSNAVIDIGSRCVPAGQLPVLVSEGIVSDQEPTIRAVFSACSQFRFKRNSAIESSFPFIAKSFQIVRSETIVRESQGSRHVLRRQSRIVERRLVRV